jgi:hypothetical protein
MYLKRSKKFGVDYHDDIPNTNISVYMHDLIGVIKVKKYRRDYRCHTFLQPFRVYSYLPKYRWPSFLTVIKAIDV